MGRGRDLTDYEKGQIDALLREKKSYTIIADAINRSKTAIGNYAKRRDMRNNRAGRGRPKILSDKAVRVLTNTAKRQGMTAAKVLQRTGVCCSLRTVQRRLQDDE